MSDLDELLACIGHGGCVPPASATRCSWMDVLGGRVLPSPDAYRVPVAKKIRSCWHVSDALAGESISNEIDVELMLANHFLGAGAKGEALLAVRILGPCRNGTSSTSTRARGPSQGVIGAEGVSVA